MRDESRQPDGPNLQRVIDNTILLLNCPFSFISPPTSYPSPLSSNSYRSELAGSRLSSIVGVSWAYFCSVGAKGTNISQTSTFICSLISSFCLHSLPAKSFIAHDRAFPELSGLTGIFFCTDFHQPKQLRLCASGTYYVNMCCIMLGFLKKSWCTLIAVGHEYWVSVGRPHLIRDSHAHVLRCEDILRTLEVRAGFIRKSLSSTFFWINFRNRVSDGNLSRHWTRKKKLFM